MNRRFDLLFAWLTLLPYWTDLPERAQRRGMETSAKKTIPPEGGKAGFLRAGRVPVKRTSPPKLWLSENEVTRLRAERLPSKSEDAWYRMFGLLFPDMDEDGPDGYRAKYTPCK